MEGSSDFNAGGCHGTSEKQAGHLGEFYGVLGGDELAAAGIISLEGRSRKDEFHSAIGRCGLV